VIDSPIPGIPPWNQIVRLPRCGTSLRRPGRERLVAGRERIYLDRFWNEFARDRRRSTKRPAATTRDLRQARRDAFRVRPVPRIDRKDEARQPQGDGDEAGDAGARHRAAKAFGANVAVVMRNAATNVQELVVPNAGHWLMEEAPAATIAAVQDFLAAH